MPRSKFEGPNQGIEPASSFMVCLPQRRMVFYQMFAKSLNIFEKIVILVHHISGLKKTWLLQRIVKCKEFFPKEKWQACWRVTQLFTSWAGIQHGKSEKACTDGELMSSPREFWKLEYSSIFIIYLVSQLNYINPSMNLN